MSRLIFLKFYRKEFKILFDIFTSTVNNHFQKIVILLDIYKEHENYEVILKKSSTLRNIIPWAFRIVKLVLTSLVSSASNGVRLVA